MKGKLLLALCLVLSRTFVYGQEEFVVKGMIRGAAEGTVVSVDREYGMSVVNIGKGVVRKGKFIIRGKTEEIPAMVRLSVEGDSCFRGVCHFWMGKGINRIKGNSALVSIWEVRNRTAEQREENRLVKKVQDEIEEYDTYFYDNLNEYSAELADCFVRSVPQLTDYPVSRKLDSLLEQKNLGLLEVIGKQGKISRVELHKLSEIVSGLRFVNVSDLQREKMKEMYLKLDTVQKNSIQGNLIHAFLYTPKIAEVGDEMVDGVLFDLEGKKHHLSDYKGRYILLDFWGAYCGACVQAQPELEEITRKYQDSLYVIGISLETSRKIWQESARNLPGIQLSDLRGEGGVVASYGFVSIPQFVIIGRDGKIKAKWVGYGPGLIEFLLKKCWKREVE